MKPGRAFLVEEPTAQDVVRAIRGFRFHYSNEKGLQEGIAKAFLAKGIGFEREKPVGKAGRIDFLVKGGIGVEIKTKGSPSATARQLVGYLECPEVREIVLVTARSSLGRLPAAILGKRVTVAALWIGFL